MYIKKDIDKQLTFLKFERYNYKSNNIMKIIAIIITKAII